MTESSTSQEDDNWKTFDGQVTGPWTSNENGGKENSLNKDPAPKLPATLGDSKQPNGNGKVAAILKDDELPSSVLTEYAVESTDAASKKASPSKNKQPKSERAKKWKNRLAKKAAGRTSVDETNNIAEVIQVEGSDPENMVTIVKEDKPIQPPPPTPEETARVERLIQAEHWQAQAEAEEAEAETENNIAEVIAIEGKDPETMTEIVKVDTPIPPSDPTPEKMAEAERLVQAEHLQAELIAQEQAAEAEAEEIAKVFQQDQEKSVENDSNDFVVPVDPKEELEQEETAIRKQEEELRETKAEEVAQTVQESKEALQEKIREDVEGDVAKEQAEIAEMKAEQEFQAKKEAAAAHEATPKQDAKNEETRASSTPAKEESPSKGANAVDTSSSANPKLIVLIAAQSFGNPTQRANQDRAMAMIASKFGAVDNNNTLVEVVDGTEPSNKERRNELFGISGIRAKYPQFFVQKDSTTSFLGDYEWIEGANEMATLTPKALLGMEMEEETKESKALDAPAATDRNVAVDVTPASTEPTVVAAEQKEAETMPRAQLIVLISKSSSVLAQRTKQDRAMAMLKGKFQAEDMEIVDGSDWSNTKLRSDLFAISGIRGNYPQFFFKNKEGTSLSFLGDFEWIEKENDNGTLTKAAIFDGVVESKPVDAPVSKPESAVKPEEMPKIVPTPSEPKEPPKDRSLPVTPAAKSAEKSTTPVAKPETTVSTPKSEPKQVSSSTTKTKPPPVRSASGTPSAPVTEINGKRMILLISSFGGGVKQKANQFRAKNILQSGKAGNKIHPEEIDAANPFHKDLIASLKGISGVQDKYPQLFLKDMVLGTYTYVGGVGTLEKHHKEGTVTSLFGSDNASKSSPNKTKTTSKAVSTSRGLDLPADNVDSSGRSDEADSLPMLHIAVAALGVAVGIGVWMVSRPHR